VAAMPGVPREMAPMLAEQLLPWLAQRYGVRQGIFTRTIHTCGMSESELDTRIEDLFRGGENPKIAVLAHEWRVDVKVMAKASDAAAAQRLIEPVEREIRVRLGDAIFGVDGATLEGAIVAALTGDGLTLATAESITGGGISDALVRVPGASACLRGGVVAYANDVKTQLLRVDPALLGAAGAVSEQVAGAMASGARTALGADLALASTGIAGPSGATSTKPVGLIWFAIADGTDVVTQRIVIPGDRGDIRRRAVVVALNFLRRQILARRAASGVRAG
jgi:nicotinamide-nucleotide amidase